MQEERLEATDLVDKACSQLGYDLSALIALASIWIDPKVAEMLAPVAAAQHAPKVEPSFLSASMGPVCQLLCFLGRRPTLLDASLPDEVVPPYTDLTKHRASLPLR